MQRRNSLHIDLNDVRRRHRQMIDEKRKMVTEYETNREVYLSSKASKQPMKVEVNRSLKRTVFITEQGDEQRKIHTRERRRDRRRGALGAFS